MIKRSLLPSVLRTLEAEISPVYFEELSRPYTSSIVSATCSLSLILVEIRAYNLYFSNTLSVSSMISDELMPEFLKESLSFSTSTSNFLLPVLRLLAC